MGGERAQGRRNRPLRSFLLVVVVVVVFSCFVLNVPRYTQGLCGPSSRPHSRGRQHQHPYLHLQVPQGAPGSRFGISRKIRFRGPRPKARNKRNLLYSHIFRFDPIPHTLSVTRFVRVFNQVAHHQCGAVWGKRTACRGARGRRSLVILPGINRPGVRSERSSDCCARPFPAPWWRCLYWETTASP